MSDDTAPSTAKVLEQLSDPQLTKSLLKFAGWLTGSDAAAEDLLSDGILRARRGVEGRRG